MRSSLVKAQNISNHFTSYFGDNLLFGSCFVEYNATFLTVVSLLSFLLTLFPFFF